MVKQVFVSDRVDQIVKSVRVEMNQNYAYTAGYLQSLLVQAIDELPIKKQEQILSRFERYTAAK